MTEERKEYNNSLKVFAKGSIIIFIGIFLSKLFTYLYRIVVARFYGPDIYGVLALSLMILGWFSILAGLGLNNGLTRFLSIYRGKNEEEKAPWLFSNIFKILLITSTISSILLFMLSDFIAITFFNSPELSLFLKIIAFTIPLSHLTGTFLASLRAYEKIGVYSLISKIIETGGKLFFLIIFLFFGLGIFLIPLSYLLAGITTFLIALILSKKYLPLLASKKSKKDPKILKKVFSYSLPLILFGFAISLLHQTDSFMIGFFLGVKEVGLYNAAIPIALLVTISIDLFRQLFLPIATKEYSRGKKKLVEQISKQITKWTLLVSFPIFILIFLFPGAFIKLFFGEEFLVAATALQILVIGAMFTNSFEISKELLLMKGKSKLILFDIAIVVMTNITLNLILIPPYGINGAAIATSISLILLGLTYFFQAGKIVKIFIIRRKILNLLFASLYSGILLYLISLHINSNLRDLIASIIIFSILYLIGLFAFRVLDKNDLEILNTIKKRFI